MNSVLYTAAYLGLAGSTLLGVAPDAGAKEGRKPKGSGLQKGAIGALQTRNFDVNSINCVVSNRGMFARDPVTGNSGLEFPTGSNHYAVYAAGLWMGGYVGGDLRVTAAEYSYDYRGGPYGTQDDGNVIYGVVKLSRATVDLLSDDDPLNDVQADPEEANDYNIWLQYPTAPTEVKNGKRIPKLTGDQTVYTVYHDGGDPDTEDTGKKLLASRPLNVEVRQTVFGYAATGPLGNIMFIRYQIYNRGTQNVDSTFVALWSDPDLGDASDDLVGVDVDKQLGYIYNGDNNDASYGTDAPSVGYDFFQGPRVPGEETDSTFAFGRYYKGFVSKGISGFAGYTNGGTYIRDPANVDEAYNFLNGFTQAGAPIDRQAPASRYLYAGDPVTGTGSLDGKLDPPGDRRLLLAAGPFTLAVGDSQEVVAAIVVGSGAGSNLANITAMRTNDLTAQNVFDANFAVAPPPPAPEVMVSPLDRRVVLYWDDRPEKLDATLGYDSLGYVFQGYNVYQLATRGAQLGTSQAKLIATYDVVDSIDVVLDNKLDPNSGVIFPQPVAFGKNSGIIREYTATTDKFTNQPLVNGRTYYYAVTAYAVNLNPLFGEKVKENSLSVLSVQPGSLSSNVRVRGNVAGATIDSVSQTAGSPSDAQVVAQVVDPAQLRDARYVVKFTTVNGELAYTIDRVDASGTTQVKPATTSFSMDPGSTGAVDGLRILVDAPPVGIKPVNLGANPNGSTSEGYAYVPAIPSRDRTFRATQQFAGSVPGLEGTSIDGIFAYPNEDHPYFGNATDITPEKLTQVEIVIDSSAGGSSKAYRYLRRATAAFAGDGDAADLIKNKVAGYPYQDARDIPVRAYKILGNGTRQQVDLGFLENNESIASTNGALNGRWDPQTVDNGLTGGQGAGREVLYIFDQAYSNGTNPPMTNALNDFKGVSYIFNPKRRAAANPEIFRSGDKIYITPYFFPSPGAEYTIDASQFAAQQNDLTAAAAEVDRINVVPNPYLGYNVGERDPVNRFVQFTHLPPKATIRIFSLDGRLIRTVEKTTTTSFQEWDLRNSDDLPVASGIYIYQVLAKDASGNQIGQKVGKLAIITREERLDTF